MSLSRRVGGVVATNMVALGLTAVTQVVVTRLLSTAARGQYDASIGLITLAAAVLAFGWPNAAIHQLRSGGADPRDVVGVAMLGVGAVAVIVGPLMWLFRDPISQRLLAGAPERVLLPVGLALLFTLLTQVLGSVARGLLWFGRFNASRVIDAAGVLAASTLLLTTVEADAVIAITGAVVGDAVALAYLAITVARYTGMAWRPDRRVAASSIRYGLLAYAQSLAGLVHERVDILLLAMFMVAPTEIGRYGVAVVVVNLVRSIPEAIGTSSFPDMASAPEAESAAMAARLCRVSMLATIVTGGAAVAAAPIALPLVFGSDYSASFGLLLTLAPASLGLAVYRILGRWFLAVDRHGAGIWSQTIALVLNLALNILFIPRWGAAGAALATLISYTVSGYDIARRFNRETGLGLRDTLVPTRGDLRSLTLIVRRAARSGRGRPTPGS